MKRDSVDEALAEWAVQLPDLDLSGRHILWRLALIDRRIDQLIDDTIAGFGLSGSSFRLMLRLLRAGPPYQSSPSELAKEALYSSGAMTNLIARAESQGFVVRSPDPHDRRGVLVGLTPAGLERIQAAHAAYLVREREVLGMLSKDDRDALIQLLRTMLVALEE